MLTLKVTGIKQKFDIKGRPIGVITLEQMPEGECYYESMIYIPWKLAETIRIGDRWTSAWGLFPSPPQAKLERFAIPAPVPVPAYAEAPAPDEAAAPGTVAGIKRGTYPLPDAVSVEEDDIPF